MKIRIFYQRARRLNGRGEEVCPVAGGAVGRGDAAARRAPRRPLLAKPQPKLLLTCSSVDTPSLFVRVAPGLRSSSYEFKQRPRNWNWNLWLNHRNQQNTFI